MIDHNPVGPRPEISSVGVVGCQIRDDFNEYFLGDVRRVVMIHDHLERDVINPWLMVGHQLLQGFSVAVQSMLNKNSIRIVIPGILAQGVEHYVFLFV